MSSEEESCSDCKLALIEKIWTQILINWINKCVSPKNLLKQITLASLVETIDKYKHDICTDDIERALLCSDDLEPFIKYKYPILRLRYFSEIKDLPKKLYLMATILLFHCCVNSQTGLVDGDICNNLDKVEQETILKFCENLCHMEVTANNIDTAIIALFQLVCRGTTGNRWTDLIKMWYICSWDACKTITTLPIKSSSLESSVMPMTMSSSVIRSKTSSEYTAIPSSMTFPSDLTATSTEAVPKKTVLKFKSSVTVLPSALTEMSSLSQASLEQDPSLSDYASYGDVDKLTDDYKLSYSDSREVAVFQIEKYQDIKEDSSEFKRRCKSVCDCIQCNTTGVSCGDPGSSMDQCNDEKEDVPPNQPSPPKHPPPKKIKWTSNRVKIFLKESFVKWKKYIIIVGICMLILIVITLCAIPFMNQDRNKKSLNVKRFIDEVSTLTPNWSWKCENKICQRVYRLNNTTKSQIYNSLSRCTLLCMGPQIWPYPIGYTYFSKQLVAFATSKLEYKFVTTTSDAVNQYLAEAFKLFIGDLVRLERLDIKSKNHTEDLIVQKINVHIEVESDPDPRLRINTDEGYSIKIDGKLDEILIKISSASFCGVRHGLETLTQLILLDQSTGHLITLSNVIIKDAPSYKYRGLMVDTARNYIPVPDLMGTIDAMAMSKLNTFHWRISDVTSFPLMLDKLPQLFNMGAYDNSMVYTKEDVKTIVKRARIRGIRVLIEVAAPGPVGRAWSWSEDVTCPVKNENYACKNILCLRFKMQDSIFDILQIIYSEILEMTKVDDIFHLSDGMFSLSNCYYLIDDREGFLDKALERLKLANKGFLPKLPVIWYTNHLSRDFEAKTWERFGVQLNEWYPNLSEQFLSKFKVIHSSRWDLSCEMRMQRCWKYRTWQEMYAWKSWRNLEVFTIEGGEAILWTDLVDSSNLDYHIWPRAAAVAERLWSDIVANSTADLSVHLRLDTHRWRMLLRGVKVQPLWPAWCSFNPGSCLVKGN